jgi:hypothetical protein
VQPVDFSRCVAVLCFQAFSFVLPHGLARYLGGVDSSWTQPCAPADRRLIKVEVLVVTVRCGSYEDLTHSDASSSRYLCPVAAFSIVFWDVLFSSCSQIFKMAQFFESLCGGS